MSGQEGRASWQMSGMGRESPENTKVVRGRLPLNPTGWEQASSQPHRVKYLKRCSWVTESYFLRECELSHHHWKIPQDHVSESAVWRKGNQGPGTLRQISHQQPPVSRDKLPSLDTWTISLQTLLQSLLEFIQETSRAKRTLLHHKAFGHHK